jgi:hypothetical protein
MSHDIQNGARHERVIFALYSLSKVVQFEYHCSCQQHKRDISILNLFFLFIQKTYIKIKFVWLPVMDNFR